MNGNNIKQLRNTLVDKGYLSSDVSEDAFEQKMSNPDFRQQFRGTLVDKGFLSEEVTQPQFDKKLGFEPKVGIESQVKSKVPEQLNEFVSTYSDIQSGLTAAKRTQETVETAQRGGGGKFSSYQYTGETAETKEEELTKTKANILDNYDAFEPIKYSSVVNTVGEGEEDVDEVATRSKMYLENYENALKEAKDIKLNQVSDPQLKDILSAISDVGVTREDTRLELEGNNLIYENQEGKTATYTVPPQDLQQTQSFLSRQTVYEQQRDLNKKSVYKYNEFKRALNNNARQARQEGGNVKDAIVKTYEEYDIKTPFIEELKKDEAAEINRTVVGASAYNTIDKVAKTGENIWRSLAEGYKSVTGEEDTQFDNAYQKQLEQFNEEQLDDETKRLMYGTMPYQYDGGIEDRYAEVDGHRVLVDGEGNPKGIRRKDGTFAYNPTDEEKTALSKYYNNREEYKEDITTDFRPLGLLGTTSQVLSDMVPIIGSSTLTAGLGGSAMVGLAGGTFSVTYGEFYNEQFEKTGDAGNAALYATAASSLTALLEGAGGVEASLARRIGKKQAVALIDDVAAEAAAKKITDGQSLMKLFGQRLKRDNLGELATEISQTVGEHVLNSNVNNESVTAHEFWNEMKTVILTTPLATTPISTLTSTVGLSEEIIESYEIAARKQDKFNEVLDNWVENSPNEEVRAERTKDASKKRAIVNELSETINALEELDIPQENSGDIMKKSKQLALLKSKQVGSGGRASDVLGGKIKKLEQEIKVALDTATKEEETAIEEEVYEGVSPENIPESEIVARRDEAVERGDADRVQVLEEEMKGRNIEFDSKIDEALEQEQVVNDVTIPQRTEDVRTKRDRAVEEGNRTAVRVLEQELGRRNEEFESRLEEVQETTEQTAQEEVIPEYEGIFSTETTGLPSIDEIRGDDAQYFNFYKGKTADIEYMSPDEYLNALRPTMGNIEQGITEQSIQRINEGVESGDKIDMPYLEYNEEGTLASQEGRNRAVAAKQRGEELIPVTVVRSIDEKGKTELSKTLIDESIQRGNTTKEEVLEDLQKNIHRDAYFFINKSEELDNYIEQQAAELRARQEETVEQTPEETVEETEQETTEEVTQQEAEPTEEVVEEAESTQQVEQEQAAEPEEEVQYVRRDIGGGETQVLRVDPDGTKTPVNEDMVPEGAEVTQETEPTERSPQKEYTRYVQRLLAEENNAPQEVKDYVEKSDTKQQPRISLDHIKFMARKAVEAVTTLADIHATRDMLRERMSNTDVIENDRNGWELLAMRLLAKRASNLGYEQLAAEIEIEIGNAGRRYGQAIMSLRVIEDLDTHVDLMAKRLLSEDTENLNKKDEVTGKTPLEQMSELIDKIKPDQETTNKFLDELRKKFPEELAVKKEPTRKRRAGTTLKMSETEIKAQNAYDRFQQALKESKGYAGALGNPKLFEAAFELMKYAYYKAKGSIEQATNIFNRVKEENELDIEANEVLESSEFVKFREGADQTIAQQEQQRKERIVKNFADRILNPKRGTKTAQSELSKALATVKRNQREGATDSSIAEDIRKNGVTLDELIEAKTIVEEKLEAGPADKATLLNQIDDIIEAVTGKAIKKAKLRKEIARGAKSLNRTVLDLAKDYYTQKQVKKDLVAEIIESTGLDKAKAQKYADQIEQTFDEIIADHVEKIATKERDSFIKENLRLAKEELKELVSERDALQEKPELNREERRRLRELENQIKKTGKLIQIARRRVKRALKSAPSVKKLVELVKSGILDEKQLAYEFYELFDLNRLTANDQNELVRLIREYESKKRDIDKQRAIHDITDFLQEKAKAMSAPEKALTLFQEYSYLNMLSNLYTPFRALIGNTYVFLTKHMTADFIMNVKDSITKDPQIAKVYIQSLLDGMRGLFKSRSAVGDVLATGRTTEIIFDIDSKLLNTRKVISDFVQRKIDAATKDLKEGSIAAKARALGTMAALSVPMTQMVVVRGLISMDIISKSFIIPYLSNQIAMREVLQQGYDKNAVDLVSQVDDLVGKTSSLRRAVVEDSQAQGFIKPSHTYEGKQYVGTEENPELDSKGNRIPYSEYKKTEEYKQGLKDKKEYEKFRYNELLPEFADGFINREATSMATEMAMQGTVYGGIGKYLNPLIDFKKRANLSNSTADKAKAAALTVFFPFMRLAGISYNLIKGATPFNLLQLTRNEEGHWDRSQGVWGFKLRDERRKWKNSGTLEESSKLSHYEKMLNYSYAVVPTMVATSIIAMLFDIEWDEEEQQLGLKLENENWRITGGSLPYSKTQELAGYDQFAIQYKNDEGEWRNIINYDDIPMGVLLSPIGDMSDEMYTNPKSDFVSWDMAAMFIFTGATNFISNYGWSSTFGAITNTGEAIAEAVSPQESLQENYRMEQLTKRLVRPLVPGGGLFSFINRAAIKYAGTDPKTGDKMLGKYVNSGWGAPLADNIATSWMFDNVRVDAFGQPYQPDMDNPAVADFIEGYWEDNIDDITSGFIAPKKEKPEYVKALQKFDRANGIGLYYPYKASQKQKDGIQYRIIEDLPSHTLDNINRKAALNVKRLGEKFLDEIKAIDNHVDMINVHNTIMQQAKDHAWGEEVLNILEQNELWEADREDFLANPKTFGITEDGEHYAPRKIKDYIFENGFKLVGEELKPHEYKVRVGNIEVED